MRRYTEEVRRAAVEDVRCGASYSEVARRYGACPSSVKRWVMESAEEPPHPRIAPRPSRARATVIEIQTPKGRMLAVENVSRSGEPLGTITRVGGAPAGAGGKVRGRILRRWSVDAALMRSLMDCAVRAAER